VAAFDKKRWLASGILGWQKRALTIGAFHAEMGSCTQSGWSLWYTCALKSNLGIQKEGIWHLGRASATICRWKTVYWSVGSGLSLSQSTMEGAASQRPRDKRFDTWLQKCLDAHNARAKNTSHVVDWWIAGALRAIGVHPREITLNSLYGRCLVACQRKRKGHLCLS